MLTASELKSVLRQQSIRLTKRLGQHHLIDARVIERLIDRCDLRGTETVVEIGAGLGALTEPIARRVKRLIALEIDPRCARWLAERFAKNVPYDQWVRELILAEGNSAEQGAPAFMIQFRGQALETAEAVSKIFLGTQIRCARCHDHPSDKWSQKDFYGFAAFFARLAVVDGGGGEGKKKLYLGEKSTGDLMFTGPAKDAKPGQKGEPISAKYLDGPVVEEPPLPQGFKEPDWRTIKTAPPKPGFSRKERLAAWITAPGCRFG